MTFHDPRGVSGPGSAPRAERHDWIFSKRSAEEFEFLPAALEAIDTPPPPLPRIVALVILALLCLTLLWACVGTADVVAVAPSRVQPVGGGKVVQALGGGRVTAILVRDGDRVRRGQALVKLEPTEPQADLDRLAGELSAADLEVARLRVLALGAPFVSPAGVGSQEADVARRQAEAEQLAHRASLAELSEQIAQRRSEASAGAAETDRLAALLPLTRQRNDAYKELTKRGFGARLQQVDAQQREEDMSRSLEVQRRKGPALQAQVRAMIQERNRMDATAQKEWLAALATAQVKASSLRKEWAKARFRVASQVIVAPVDGTVQELNLHTIGGVVAAGASLMHVAPDQVDLEIEARLLNQDVGFVREGQRAEIKIESFPFTKYGVIGATITSLSHDAVTPEAPQGARGSAAVEQPYYLARLKLDRQAMTVDGHPEPLTAGMSAVAEIKTGRRRVIEFVLAPIAKTTSEAGRER